MQCRYGIIVPPECEIRLPQMEAVVEGMVRVQAHRLFEPFNALLRSAGIVKEGCKQNVRVGEPSESMTISSPARTLRAKSGSTRLTQTIFSKPSAPRMRARKTSAIPPAPIRSSIWYLPKILLEVMRWLSSDPLPPRQRCPASPAPPGHLEAGRGVAQLAGLLVVLGGILRVGGCFFRDAELAFALGEPGIGILLIVGVGAIGSRTAEVARAIHGFCHGPLHLVHSYLDVWGEYTDRGAVVGEAAEKRREALRLGLNDMLEADAKELFPNETPEVQTHLVTGDPASAILEVASDVGATLICAGTTGKSGIERLLIGSVARRLLQDSQVPLLLTHDSP